MTPGAGTTTTPSAGAPPTPAAPAANQLPPVDVIQKKAKPAPKAAAKKAPPKKQVTAPAPQPPPPQAAEPGAPTEAIVPGTGGIDSGSVLMSPVEGSAIPIGKYPGAVGRASAGDIERRGIDYVPEVLQQTVPGVILEDAQGNVFQRTLQYRGFESSPVNGVQQGLAVYQNGVRINESFGDIVNWDFLPDNAIYGMTVIGANPVFGLNALGGAVTILMRDGFNFEGFELDFRAGSFGRAQGSLAAGGNSGNWGVFVAGEYIEDDGYRDFSSATIRRMYADLGVKGDGKEFHLNFTGANNFVGVTAAAPEQLLDLGWNRTFTSPQTTDNEMAMVSLNGSVLATPTLTFSGVTYFRWFQQGHDDGNIAEACEEDGDVGLEEDGDCEAAETADGRTLSFDDDLNYGVIDRTGQNANGWGAALQGVEKTPLFNMPNQFLLGASYDHGRVNYSTSSELGFFRPSFVVSGFDDPFIIAEPEDYLPRNLTTQNDYVGVYFSDTMDLTDKLALTVGGRYNFARIVLQDNTGENPSLNGDHTYERFNPMVGATYQWHDGLTMYGGYAEANRAPTAAELACADPEEPCLIESFLTADPPLEQVVSHTYEFGFRGALASWGRDQRLEWSAGLFHALNTSDIISVAAPTSGRGFFQNAGDTLRQGVEIGGRYTEKRMMVYANYAFVQATFQTALELPSPDNPLAVPCSDAPTANCVNIQSGDRLPGVPQNRWKTGFEYWITEEWKFGADLLAATSQFFYGDEANQNAPLPGYVTVDINTSYDVTEHVQIYGLIDNLFDSRYGLFGTFFDLDAGNEGAEADGLGDDFFTNPRTIVPAPPITAYGGVRVKY